MRFCVALTFILIFGCSRDEPRGSQPALKPLGIPLTDVASKVLREGTEFQLYSIDPSFGGPGPHSDGFHGFAILGATPVSDSERKQLVDALAAGVEESVGAIAACFNPRHAIHVQHEGKRHDFLICFECLQIYWYTDDEKNSTILTSESPQGIFDQVLSDASVPLADPE